MLVKFKKQTEDKLKEINLIYDKINDLIKVSCFNNDDISLCEPIPIKKNKPKDIIEYIGRTFGYFGHEEKLKTCGITNYVILQQFEDPDKYYVVSPDAQPKCKIDDSTLRYFKLNNNMSLTEINKATISVENILCLRQDQKLYFSDTDKFELANGKMLKSNFIGLINTIKKNIISDNITKEQLDITPIEKLFDILYRKNKDGEYMLDVIRKYDNIVLFLVHINHIKVIYEYVENPSVDISTDVFINLKESITYKYNYYTYLSQLYSINDSDKTIDKINKYLYKPKDKIFEEFMEQVINLCNILKKIKEQFDGNFILSNFLDKLFNSSNLPIPINKQIVIETITEKKAKIYDKTTEDEEVKFLKEKYNYSDQVFNFTPEFEMLNYEQVKFEGYSFPNCGENTLFNLINYLITHKFNNGIFKFDPNFKSNSSFQKLKKPDGTESNLYKFYDKFKDYNDLITAKELTQNIKNEFSSIFQKITSEAYVYKQGNVCEINPSEKNLIIILNTVLGQNFSNMTEFIKYFYEKDDEKHEVKHVQGERYIIDSKYILDMHHNHSSISSSHAPIKYRTLVQILKSNRTFNYSFNYSLSYEKKLLLYGRLDFIFHNQLKRVRESYTDGFDTKENVLSFINSIHINYINLHEDSDFFVHVPEILEKLLENTENMSIFFYKNITSGDIYGVKFLLDKGVGVNVQDNDGETPLLLSIQFRNPEITKLLLEKGAEVNVQNNDGKTPLLLSIIDKDEEIILEILKHKPVLTAEYRGQTALDLAKFYNLDRIKTKIESLMSESSMSGGVYIDYKQKYFKYKQKYIELKKYHKI